MLTLTNKEITDLEYLEEKAKQAETDAKVKHASEQRWENKISGLKKDLEDATKEHKKSKDDLKVFRKSSGFGTTKYDYETPPEKDLVLQRKIWTAQNLEINLAEKLKEIELENPHPFTEPADKNPKATKKNMSMKKLGLLRMLRLEKQKQLTYKKQRR